MAVFTTESYGGEETPRASDILYLNNGDGTFTDATAIFGLDALKNDVDLDLFIANGSRNPPVDFRIWHLEWRLSPKNAIWW